jgi:putative membrane protein
MRPPIWTWCWPAAIARRLWAVVLASAAYTTGVYAAQYELGLTEPAWADEVTAVTALVIGVLVGFRTKAAYDRWWEGRCLWGELTNHSRNLCLKVVELVKPPPADRAELLRLVCGFPVALMKHLRGSVTLQAIPGFEKETAAPAHVPLYLAGRVFALVAGWRATGAIDGHTQQVLDPHALALMNVCGACEKIRTTPLPGSYLTLLRHGLVISLLFVPWHLTHALGLWAILVQAMAIYFLIGVELIAEELEQPFGFDGDDLPLERFCETIRNSAAEVLQ